MALDTLNMYIYKDSHIPMDLCDEILKHTETAEWEPHTWYSPDSASFNQQDKDPKVQYIENPFKDKLISCCIDAIQNYFVYTNVERVFANNLTAPRLNKYSVGTFMRPHVDHIHTIFDGKLKGIPTLSIVGVLNDDFEGGEFVFWNHFQVRLKKGDILVFPSNFMYQHQVLEVLEGERISFVSWAF